MGNAPGSTVAELSACESHQWYRKFMTVCPSGQLTFCEFKKFFGLKNLSETSNEYVKTMFKTFDMNDDGCIDFVEYVYGYSRSEFGSEGWSSAETALVLQALRRGRQRLHRPRGAAAHLQGELSQEEFMEGIQADEVLLKMLTQTLDLTHIIRKIYSEINSEQQLH